MTGAGQRGCGLQGPLSKARTLYLSYVPETEERGFSQDQM